MTSANAWSATVPTASMQTSLDPGQILHSGNAGVIIHRTGQLSNQFRSEGRQFAREVADHVNRVQAGVTTVLIFEEFFGTHDRIHWLIHMNSLDDYLTLIRMAVADEGFREIFFRSRISEEKGGGDWSKMFLDGSVKEQVLVPQHWPRVARRSNSNEMEGNPGSDSPVHAFDQTSLSPEQVLHSANAGVVIHRIGIPRYEYRRQAYEFALETAEQINQHQAGTATVFVYKETFGKQDRLHWLIHLNSLTAYQALSEFCDNDEEYLSLTRCDRVPGGGGWEKIFLEASLQETVLIPQFAGSQGTQGIQQQRQS